MTFSFCLSTPFLSVSQHLFFLSRHLLFMSQHLSFCLNTFSFCLNTFSFCLNTFTFCLNTFSFCLNTFSFCPNTFPFCLNTISFCLDPFSLSLSTFYFRLSIPFLSVSQHLFFLSLSLCLSISIILLSISIQPYLCRLPWVDAPVVPATVRCFATVRWVWTGLFYRWRGPGRTPHPEKITSLDYLLVSRLFIRDRFPCGKVISWDKWPCRYLFRYVQNRTFADLRHKKDYRQCCGSGSASGPGSASNWKVESGYRSASKW
jgi:hypothetical protein